VHRGTEITQPYSLSGLRKVKPTTDGDTVYLHKNGWYIVRQTRSWSLRGFPRGALGGTEATAGRKTYWVIIRSRYVKWSEEVYESSNAHDRLRDAAKWCDENPNPAGATDG
jgi:hypothetical protein